MARLLDRSMPFGEVFGIGGVKFEQNGQHYNARGEPVSVKTEFLRGETRDEDSTRYTISALAIEHMTRKNTDDDALMSKHWRELKTMLEQQGLDWPGTKEEAVRLLRGGGLQRHVEPADGTMGQNAALEMLGLA